VGKPSLTLIAFRGMKVLILERYPVVIKHAMKTLGISVLIKIVRALTVEKRTINMSNMGKPSGEAIILK
jgi:uncharacterized membrane protein